MSLPHIRASLLLGNFLLKKKTSVVFECLRKNPDCNDLDLELNEKCQKKIVQRVKEANKSMVHYFEEVSA